MLAAMLFTSESDRGGLQRDWFSAISAASIAARPNPLLLMSPASEARLLFRCPSSHGVRCLCFAPGEIPSSKRSLFRKVQAGGSAARSRRLGVAFLSHMYSLPLG